MSIFLKVMGAKYIRAYEIELSFNNGEKAKINLESELWGEVFEPLKDLEIFKDFHLNNGTIEWPNGADFAPEFLYEHAKNTRPNPYQNK